MALAEAYGETDGQNVFHYATQFTELGQSLPPEQMDTLMDYRNVDLGLLDFPCEGAWVYGKNTLEE